MTDETIAEYYERSRLGTPGTPEADDARREREDWAIFQASNGRVMSPAIYAASIGYSLDGKPVGVTAQFNQGEWWKTKDGRWLRIAEMDETHRYNTAAMLMRNAKHHAFAYSWAFVGVVSAHDGGDMAHDALERISDELNEQTASDPQGWLRSTTLYRALTKGLPTKPKKVAKLAERARHWSTCPKRISLKNLDCTCPKPTCADSSCGCSGEAHP